MTIKTFEETTPGKRIQIIFDSFRSLKSVYDNASDDDKQYFLTVQDDFLWVGTNVKFFWSGFYSEEAIRTGSRCQQHRYPRLLATEKLFNKLPDNIEDFKKLFIELIKFDYTTSAENKYLVRFQQRKIFETPEIAYESANIKLISFN
tara:strand:+ start:32 stop:472 length:441 start_codon:yes stop_codon:yes gene_type:complete